MTIYYAVGILALLYIAYQIIWKDDYGSSVWGLVVLFVDIIAILFRMAVGR